MSHCHTLGGICDQISRHQRVLHSHMSHCNTITYCDCREHDRNASCHCHTLLNGVYNLIQVHMSRYNLIVGAHNTD